MIVDLPLPEPPSTIFVSPRRTIKLILSRTTCSSNGDRYVPEFDCRDKAIARICDPAPFPHPERTLFQEVN